MHSRMVYDTDAMSSPGYPEGMEHDIAATRPYDVRDKAVIHLRHDVQ